MAYVEPHGTIELYQNVPLTPSYEHTLWFESPVAQRAYFAGKNPRAFYNQMYTRVHGNKVRIHVKADDIARYNYLGFTNDFGAGNASKWYYAFIDKIEYINEQVTEVTYILDNIQTWFMSMTFGQCFIERQHSTTDTLGDNVQPEPIVPKEHIAIGGVNDPQNHQIYYSDIAYVLVAGVVGVLDPTAFANSPIFQRNDAGGLGSTVCFLYFESSLKLNTFLKLAEFVNGVFDITGVCACQPMSLYAIPKGLFESPGNTYLSVDVGQYHGVLAILPTYANRIAGIVLDPPTQHGEPPYYTPKNKKLLTYPYTYMKVSYPTASQDFKFENFFLDGTTAFAVYGCCNPVPSIITIPVAYERDADPYHYALTLDCFPQLPVFQDGVGFGMGNLISNTVKMGLVTAAGLLTGGIGGAVGSAALDSMDGKYGVSSTALATISEYSNDNALKSAQIKQMLGVTPEITSTDESARIGYGHAQIPAFSTHSNLISGGGASALAPVMAKKYDSGIVDDACFKIVFQQFGLREETARRFDEFFSKYGYAQNKVGTPNIHARTRYTYIKTRGCCAKGAVPAEAIRAMNVVMDNGITWWVDTNVGYYTDQNGNLLDNPIRS